MMGFFLEGKCEILGISYLIPVAGNTVRMWKLWLGMGLLPVLAESNSLNAAQAVHGLKQDIDRSQQLLTEIGETLAIMTNLGHKDTPEYQDMLASYQELSRAITDGLKCVQGNEKQQASISRTTSLDAAGFDLAGITPLKGPLGPAATGTLGGVTPGQLAEVANLQKFLNAVGISAPGSGPYEARTRIAVQQFQTKYGLKVTGTVGAETRKLINDIIAGDAGSG